MNAKVDERIGMEFDVPERYEHFLTRTGLPADACTFCKRLGLDTSPAYTVLRHWKGVELGQLQSYCEELHYSDTERSMFYSSESDEPLREICPVHHYEVAANGACMGCE